MKKLGIKCAAMALAFAASAQAFTLTGKVSDESGKAIDKASVELLKNALKTTTDSKGEFKIVKEDSTIGIHAVARPRLGYVSVMNGVLSYSQSTNEPVRVQVFDAAHPHPHGRLPRGGQVRERRRALRPRQGSLRQPEKQLHEVYLRL